jgi:hypothetical protein
VAEVCFAPTSYAIARTALSIGILTVKNSKQTELPGMEKSDAGLFPVMKIRINGTSLWTCNQYDWAGIS